MKYKRARPGDPGPKAFGPAQQGMWLVTNLRLGESLYVEAKTAYEAAYAAGWRQEECTFVSLVEEDSGPRTESTDRFASLRAPVDTSEDEVDDSST